MVISFLKCYLVSRSIFFHFNIEITCCNPDMTELLNILSTRISIITSFNFFKGCGGNVIVISFTSKQLNYSLLTPINICTDNA